MRKDSNRAARLLTLEALGIVFGDIGTNALFALRAAFRGPYAIPATEPNILGVLSLFVWALTLVVGVKYLQFILRADNRGEGGTLALLALLIPRGEQGRERLLTTVGLLGTALLYGDGIVTPAISVLAAVEGLDATTATTGRAAVPIAVTVLVALFSVQRLGTGRIGAIFGPIMLVWFLALAAFGIAGLAGHPAVLAALSPRRAVTFFIENGVAGFLTLGVVVLTVAGAEALYAGLGHFGAAPIRRAWYFIAFPALVLNYLGQGARLLLDPGAVRNPFYYLVPEWARIPTVFLATAATIIASQSLIAGSFSVTRQAIQLGYLPRMTIRHTSARMAGQVYLPVVNWALLALCLALVLGFGSSERLAAAYGMAVIGAMVTTSLLFLFVTRARWRWSLARTVLIAGAFLALGTVLLGANLVKLVHGAWFPALIGAVVFVILTTWRRGTDALGEMLRRRQRSVPEFLREIGARRPVQVPGTGIFLAPSPGIVPFALQHSLERMGIVYERVVLLSVLTEDAPRVTPEERVTVERVAARVWQLSARYGFMETPDIPDILECCRGEPLRLEPARATYFLGLITLIPVGRANLARWRARLFAVLWRNERPARAAFRIPPDQVVELGLEVAL